MSTLSRATGERTLFNVFVPLCEALFDNVKQKVITVNCEVTGKKFSGDEQFKEALNGVIKE
jgi:hypothetical protein